MLTNLVHRTSTLRHNSNSLNHLLLTLLLRLSKHRHRITRRHRIKVRIRLLGRRKAVLTDRLRIILFNRQHAISSSLTQHKLLGVVSTASRHQLAQTKEPSRCRLLTTLSNRISVFRRVRITGMLIRVLSLSRIYRRYPFPTFAQIRLLCKGGRISTTRAAFPWEAHGLWPAR